jgi:hypothetical protein
MRRIFILLPALLALQVGVSPALAWTWPVDGPVLQTFNLGSDPYQGGQHRGIDIGAPAGATVVAPASGTVTFAGTLPAYGRSVTIETPDGYSVTLVHLGASSVTEGAAIGEGDQVGAIGPSGEIEVSEPYVHLGIRVATDPNGYMDPLLVLPPRQPGAGEESAPGEEGSGAAPTDDSAADTADDGTPVEGADSPAVTTTLEPPDTPAPEPPAPAEPVAAVTEAPSSESPAASGASSIESPAATEAPSIESQASSIKAVASRVEPPPEADGPPAASRPARSRRAPVPLAAPTTPAPPASHVRRRPSLRQQPRQTGQVRLFEHVGPAADARPVVRPWPVIEVGRVQQPAPTPTRASAPPLYTKRGRRPRATTGSERTKAVAGMRLVPPPLLTATRTVPEVSRPRLRKQDVTSSRRRPGKQRPRARYRLGPAARNAVAPASPPASEPRPSAREPVKARRPPTRSSIATAPASGETFSPWLAAVAGASGTALLLLALRRRRGGAPSAPAPPTAPKVPDRRQSLAEAEGSLAEALDRELELILTQADPRERAVPDSGREAPAGASGKAWWQVE